MSPTRGSSLGTKPHLHKRICSCKQYKEKTRYKKAMLITLRKPMLLSLKAEAARSLHDSFAGRRFLRMIQLLDGVEAAVEARLVTLTKGPRSGAARRWLGLTPVVTVRSCRAPAERDAEVDGISPSPVPHLSSIVPPSVDEQREFFGAAAHPKITATSATAEDGRFRGIDKVVFEMVTEVLYGELSTEEVGEPHPLDRFFVGHYYSVSY